MNHNAKKKELESSLYAFVKHFWDVIEADPYIDGWHVKALCDHYEAVTDNRISRLVINIPPGCSKSLITAVFWPAWVWSTRPDKRWFFASYDQKLSMRDSVRCRTLIESNEYQRFWGHYRLTKDQNQKLYYETTRNGYRMATSVLGHGTGEHPDFICFPYDQLVWTDKGKMQIGDIVSGEIDVDVLSMNPQNGKMEFKPVIGWHDNPGSCLVEVLFTNDIIIRCTPGHRLWTSNRGWVEACRLLSTDVLPTYTFSDVIDCISVDVESYSQYSPGFFGVEDESDLFFRQSAISDIFSGCPITFEPLSVSDFFPCCSSSDLCDRSYRDSIFLGKNPCRFHTCSNLDSLVSIDLRTRSFFEEGKCAVLFGVCDIIGSGSVTQIGEDVVSRVSVQMSDFLSFGTRANESLQNFLMDEQIGLYRVPYSSESWISFVGACFENSPSLGVGETSSNYGSRFASDSSYIRDAVQSLKPNYCSPTLVRYGGFAHRTFCLTVEDNHTFVVGGHDSIVAKNCLDDPHDIQSAESELERQAVIDWFDLTLSSRGVSRNARRVIIMQRLHIKDLSGHVLSKGDWTHICLPMRYEIGRMSDTPLGWNDPRKEEGELLAPKQFSEKKVSDLEKELGPYGTAGQLMQRPQPKGGGMFRTDWFRNRVRSSPYHVRMRIRFWDRAASKPGYSACYTAGVLMSVSEEGAYFVEDIIHGQWEPTERNSIMRATALKDRVKYGPNEEPYIFIEAERGSTGKESFQSMARSLAGYKIREDRPSGSKDTRAEPWADQLSAGNVYLVDNGESDGTGKATWNINAYLLEHENFRPVVGKRFSGTCDMIDASSGAFNLLSGRRQAGTIRVFSRRDPNKKQTQRIVVCSKDQLKDLVVEERSLLVYVSDPPLPTPSYILDNPRAFHSPAVEQLIRGKIKELSPHRDDISDSEIEHGLVRILDKVCLSFIDVDPAEMMDRWHIPYEPWNQPISELIISQEQGKKVWSGILKQRDPPWEVLVFCDGGNRIALSLAYAICDLMRFPRSVIYQMGLEEKKHDDEKAPNQHVFSMLKSTRGMVI
jgi:hypothetical protein